MRLDLSNLFFITIITLISLSCYSKDEVIFSVNNNPITTIDLNQRLNYLSILQNVEKDKINENIVVDDLLSLTLFDEFAKINNFNIKKKEIQTYYEKIINNINTNNKIILDSLLKDKKISKAIILMNIRYDLQRKKLIEIFIKRKIKKIDLNNNYNILDIYDIRINYFVISNEFKEFLTKWRNKLLNNNFYEIANILNVNKITYNKFSNNIIDIDRIDTQMKNYILDNKNNFLFEKENYTMLGTVDKKIKQNIDLKYSFFQISPKNNINLANDELEKINCANVQKKYNSDEFEIITYKSVDLEKLNISIFKNFSKENDKMIIKNNDNNFLILLCDIDYDKELAKNNLFENKIKKLAEEVEIEFIKIKKKEFNVKFY